MTMNIPFNKPYLNGNELEYVASAIQHGDTSALGSYSKKCQSLLQTLFSMKRVLLTTSGTAALEMSTLLCDINSNDEVILPSYTFVSTANAYLLQGAKPVFVDIHPDTLNIDEQLIEPAITERTKCIVPVHYAGISCNMTAIKNTASKHNLIIIEDAAQCINAKYYDSYLGTIGDLGILSFHETKNIYCGEGGALIVNEDRFLERAEIILEKGTNRNKFLSGLVDKYSWVDIGSSYALSNILAAFLIAQLEAVDSITNKRKKVYTLYMHGLQHLLNRSLLKLPTITEGCTSNYHIFYILLDNKITRDCLLNHLNQNGICATFHYIPLHTSQMGRKLGYKPGILPVTENISERILRLPLYSGMLEQETHFVIQTISEFLLKDKIPIVF